MKKIWCKLFHQDCWLPKNNKWFCWWCLTEHDYYNEALTDLDDTIKALQDKK